MDDSSSNVKATANNAVWALKGTSAGTVQLQATGMYVPYLPGDDGSLQTGVRLTYPRWIDNGNGTLTDTMTGLVWLKQADCIRQTWSDAIAAVNAPRQCGLTDGSVAGQWRMPNRQEMPSLSDRMGTNHPDRFHQTYTWKASQTLYQVPIFGTFVPSTTGRRPLTPQIQARPGPSSVAISECMTFPRRRSATRLPCADGSEMVATQILGA